MPDQPIYVTKPYLPDLNQYIELLQEPWQTGILTHNGPLVRQFEREVVKSLNVSNYIAVVNGTLALQLAIRALNLRGNIIIPAFSWIASASSALWEGLNIKFCDVDIKTFNICPDSFEKTIDSNTVAVMPVHVFGNPINIEKIESIAKAHNIKVIYDSAHAFGSVYKNRSVLSFGDISCTSTHATKIINSGEGGGLVVPFDKSLQQRLIKMRFFGHNDEKQIVDIGTNAKMTEIHAALGILSLNELKSILERRKIINKTYRHLLSDNNHIKFQELSDGANCSYFPIILQKVSILDALVQNLSASNIYPRRYFNPSLDSIQIFNSRECANSKYLSDRILCLPSYHTLSNDDIDKICAIINQSTRSI